MTEINSPAAMAGAALAQTWFPSTRQESSRWFSGGRALVALMPHSKPLLTERPRSAAGVE